MSEPSTPLNIFEVAIADLEASETHFEVSLSTLEAAQLLSVLYQALSQLDLGIYKAAYIKVFAASLISVLCEADPQLHQHYDGWGLNPKDK